MFLTDGTELKLISGIDEMDQRCAVASKPPRESFVEGRDHWAVDNFIRVGGQDDTPTRVPATSQPASHQPPMPAATSASEWPVGKGRRPLEFSMRALRDPA